MGGLESLSMTFRMVVSLGLEWNVGCFSKGSLIEWSGVVGADVPESAWETALESVMEASEERAESAESYRGTGDAACVRGSRTIMASVSLVVLEENHEC